MEKTDGPRIQISEGFYLSRITRQDKRAYLEHLSDEEISRNTLRIPFPYTEADADSWLDCCEKQACDPEKRFAIRGQTGYLIGSIGIANVITRGATSAELGYWLAKSYRGRGLMSRAISVFAEYAFRQLRLTRLYADTFAHNLASQRALEKAGFQREAILPRHHVKSGLPLDAVRYVKVLRPAVGT
jgi:RimJ/RimL family protein N-acetyltransferase